MKFYKISKIFCVIAACFSANLMAQEGQVTTYPSLHDNNIAVNAYKSFTEGAGEDPFDELVRGYKNGYSNDVVTNIRPEQYSNLSEVSIEQFEKNADFFEDISAQRNEQRRDIYADSFSEDGEFDAVAYGEAYASFLTEQKNVANKHLSAGFNNLVGVMDENNTALNMLSADVSEKSAQATVNLVNALNTNGHNSKTSMYEGFRDSLLNASNMASQAESTIILASTFSDDCGSACEFPENPTPIDVDISDPPPVAPPVTPTPPHPTDCFEGRLGNGEWRWNGETRHFYKCP